MDCQYKDWGDMVGKVGAEQAKSEVIRTLEENLPCEWQSSSIPDIVSLVVQRNSVREQGNIAAHEFEDEDILQAIEAVPEGTKRTNLTKLYNHICT